jgi:magnesium-transporting ATPase (P-type)
MFTEAGARPYQPSLRYASTVHSRTDHDGFLVNVVGAPEVVMGICSSMMTDAGVRSPRAQSCVGCVC